MSRIWEDYRDFYESRFLYRRHCPVPARAIYTHNPAHFLRVLVTGLVAAILVRVYCFGAQDATGSCLVLTSS